MLIKGKEVVWAQTHSPIFLPGIVQLKNTITKSEQPGGKPLKMTLVGQSVYFEHGSRIFLVPLSQFSHIELANPPPPLKAAVA